MIDLTTSNLNNLMVPNGEGGFTERPPASVEVLAHNMLAALNKAYGDDWMQGWKVTVDTRGGVVQVRNLLLSGKMGFTMKITQVDPEMRKVVRYAGELFERYSVARRKNIDVRESVHNLNLDFKGDATHHE